MSLKPFDPTSSRHGERYIGEDGDTWEVIGWITHPAAILQNSRTGEREVEVIGCPRAERWVQEGHEEGDDGLPEHS